MKTIGQTDTFASEHKESSETLESWPEIVSGLLAENETRACLATQELCDLIRYEKQLSDLNAKRDQAPIKSHEVDDQINQARINYETSTNAYRILALEPQLDYLSKAIRRFVPLMDIKHMNGIEHLTSENASPVLKPISTDSRNSSLETLISQSKGEHPEEAQAQLREQLAEIENAISCLSTGLEIMCAMATEISELDLPAPNSNPVSADTLRMRILILLTIVCRCSYSGNINGLKRIQENARFLAELLIDKCSKETVSTVLNRGYAPLADAMRKEYLEKTHTMSYRLSREEHINREVGRFRKSLEMIQQPDATHKPADEAKSSTQAALAAQSDLPIPGPSTNQYSASDPSATLPPDIKLEDLIQLISDLPIPDPSTDQYSASDPSATLPPDINLEDLADLALEIFSSVSVKDLVELIIEAAFQEDVLSTGLVGNADPNPANAALQKSNLSASLANNTTDPNPATVTSQKDKQIFAETGSEQTLSRKRKYDGERHDGDSVTHKRANHAQTTLTPMVSLSLGYQFDFFPPSPFPNVVTEAETAADEVPTRKMII